jgi:hypothetical protein
MAKKKLFIVISLILAKKIGFCKVNFFSKLIFNRFFTTTKYAQIKKIIQNLQQEKVVKIKFREKVHKTDPYYFC